MYETFHYARISTLSVRHKVQNCKVMAIYTSRIYVVQDAI